MVMITTQSQQSLLSQAVVERTIAAIVEMKATMIVAPPKKGVKTNVAILRTTAARMKAPTAIHAVVRLSLQSQARIPKAVARRTPKHAMVRLYETCLYHLTNIFLQTPALIELPPLSARRSVDLHGTRSHM